MRDSVLKWHRCGAVVLAGAALYVVLAAASPTVARADNWGCDMVNGNSGLGLVDDCGNNGSCCDAHDDGYRIGGCSASSWFHLMCSTAGTQCAAASFCDGVNAGAVVCILSQHPGPGMCCDFGGHNICQQSRNPNNYWGCNSDAWCSSNSRCDIPSGTCVPVCTDTTPTQCGVSWTDSCGNHYAPVGCPDPLQCVNGTCVRCQAATCAAHDGQCGSFDDGCGGTIDCGCQDPLTCQSGACVPACTPLTCDDFGATGTFWDSCSAYISCDFGDPGDGSDDTGSGGSGDPGGGGGGCAASMYPPWCPFYCTDIAEE